MALAKTAAQVGTNRASARAVAAALGLNEGDKSRTESVNRRYLAAALGFDGEGNAGMTVDGVVARANARLADDIVSTVQVDGNDDNILSWGLPDGWLPPVSWKVQWRDSAAASWVNLITTDLTGWTDRERQGRAQTGQYGILGTTPWGDLRRAVVDSTRTLANPSISNKITEIGEGGSHSYDTTEPAGFRAEEISWKTTHGSISATGILRAPYVNGTTVITVSLLYYGVVVDTDTVLVNNTVDARFTNAPLTVPSGGTFQFTWSASTAVTFSTTEGTIDEDGEWDIPTVTRTTHARVTLLQGGATAQSVDIQITVADLTPEISNKIASLEVGQQHVYTIENQKLSDSVYLRVASGPGRILGSATLEATGSVAGTVVVQLVEDGGVVDTDTVSVTVPVTETGSITNKISTIAEGASHDFAPSSDASGTVTWDATGGTVTKLANGKGRFTAGAVGSAGGNGSVSMLVDGVVVDTDAFTVTDVPRPPPLAFSITADVAGWQDSSGGRRCRVNFRANVSGGTGTYTYSPTWNLGYGWARFYAQARRETFTASVTSGGVTRTASVTVTVPADPNPPPVVLPLTCSMSTSNAWQDTSQGRRGRATFGLSASGGTPPYSFNPSSVVTVFYAANAGNLGAAITRTITVTDAAGRSCSKTGTVIATPDPG